MNKLSNSPSIERESFGLVPALSSKNDRLASENKDLKEPLH
jgi:hypothetical protein